ncbi:clavesin-2-like [Ptychodera flava]|uniref:clavesin-2-like n=1 Tax=Ptychodera flava TaxID=63121 RepID=UPI00396A9CCC
MADWCGRFSPETELKAQKELNENPATRDDDIQSVRDLVVTRPDIKFIRTDDAFILRFLRARKFDTYEAFRLYARYYEYRQIHKAIFQEFSVSNPEMYQALMDGFPAVLDNTDHFGRKILVLNTANWEVWRYPYIHILRAMLLSLEYLIQDEETQIHGFVIIVDWTAFSFKQAARLSPGLMRLTIEGLQDCFPARFGGIHFVNQPWYVEAAFAICRPFLKQNTKKKIFLHGNNLTTLHSHIHKEILPSELGGLLPAYNIGKFARELLEQDFGIDYGSSSPSSDHKDITMGLTRSLSVPLANDQYNDKETKDDSQDNMELLLTFD